MKKHTGLLTTYILLALVVLSFSTLFLTGGFSRIDFWWWMSGTLIVVLLAAFIMDRGYREHLAADCKKNVLAKIGGGLLAAGALYGVFFVGNYISRLIFPFAGENINNVYTMKSGVSFIRLVVLMALVIGPGEELFWRAYLQNKLSDNYGILRGFLGATFFYTITHVASLNFMLICAAGICGAFWGLLYLKFKSPLLNIISHTVWDLLVFIFFPFQ